MEVLLVLVVVVAVPVVVIAARRGAEAAQAERERRWAELPAEPSGARPVAIHEPGRRAEATAAIRRVTAATAKRAEGGGPPAANPGAGPPPAGRSAGLRQATPSAAPRTTDRLGAGPRPRPEPALGTVVAERTGRVLSAARAAAARAADRPAGPSPASAEPSASGGAARPAPPPVDVNSAPVDELRKLPGVGVRAAERIVAHRERYGGFASVDDLEAVEGFDHHRVSRLAPRAKV